MTERHGFPGYRRPENEFTFSLWRKSLVHSERTRFRIGASLGHPWNPPASNLCLLFGHLEAFPASVKPGQSHTQARYMGGTSQEQARSKPSASQVHARYMRGTSHPEACASRSEEHTSEL